MQGNEVRERERAQHLILGNLILHCVDEHRHGDGDALVAAAGVDDNRHCAAVHSCVGTGGGVGAGAVDERAGLLGDGAADLGAPRVLEPLLGDGAVALDLIFKHLAHVVKVYLVCEIIDIADVQQAFVGCRGGGAFLLRLSCVIDDLAVFLDAGDVAVVVLYLDERGLVALVRLDADIEIRHTLDQLAVTAVIRDHLVHKGNVLIAYGVEHIQNSGCVAADDAEQSGSVNAARAARVRDGDGHDVFHDVPAAIYRTVLRYVTEHLAKFRAGIRDGNGLGTACRHCEFIMEQLNIIVIYFLIHYDTPSVCVYFSA